jgi:hypothetical protein
MKSTPLKSVLFAALALVSLSCFIYVNTTSLDRTLQVAGVNQPTVETVEEVGKNAKMPDLTLVKSVLTLVQTFFPAK